ncbi:hypothetical protein NBO_463g0007 [Nosema bombycis CQ1]|uniref:Uncharacterized protein n=1 Tax=Nosema bombycis (strain CQ1 / CVCC 102059) TaxID=578461 RepID=R0MHR7_NOSB1|nr:hypothetical protein NBO_463g0007 [Nosema bombycis CQ1]|eukprot:EOB12328.1 hypothetical protein NBO_463g0007 [Nosema bombycis CQ1]
MWALERFMVLYSSKSQLKINTNSKKMCLKKCLKLLELGFLIKKTRDIKKII